MFADLENAFILTLFIWGICTLIFFASPLKRKKVLKRLFLIVFFLGFFPACIVLTEVSASLNYGEFPYSNDPDPRPSGAQLAARTGSGY